jgi:hypothetical protein
VRLLFHYTDKSGANAIRSQLVWRFLAQKPPPEDHPVGAYFTDYDQGTPKLANKLRIPRAKLAWVFAFEDAGDLRPLEGDRGQHIFYSPADYDVVQERQAAGFPQETGL